LVSTQQLNQCKLREFLKRLQYSQQLPLQLSSKLQRSQLKVRKRRKRQLKKARRRKIFQQKEESLSKKKSRNKNHQRLKLGIIPKRIASEAKFTEA